MVLFDSNRPCGTTTRKSNRYTRKELEAIARQSGINPKNKTMDQLCKELLAKTPKTSKIQVKSIKTTVPTRVTRPTSPTPKTKVSLPPAPKRKLETVSSKRYPRLDFPWVKNIGRGAFSKVYLATDRKTQRNVIIKQIDKSVSRKDVEKEVQILHYLKDYCDLYILCWIDYYEDSNYYYIITEFLDNFVDLYSYLDREGILDPAKLSKIMLNLAQGLKKINDLGVVHRDLKLENILINPSTLEIKYLDFGLSCFEQECQELTFIGTASYISPEAWATYRGSIPRPASLPATFDDLVQSDLWSLGMIFYELLTGQNYFKSFEEQAEEMYRKYQDPRRAQKFYHDQIYQILVTEKEPLDLKEIRDPQYRKMLEKILIYLEPGKSRLSLIEIINDLSKM